MGRDFGMYFREIRKKYGKTQLDLAEAIGKTTMLISGIENGKNNPPRGKDLEIIMNTLGLSKFERIEMIDRVAQDTNSLPEDIGEFILSSGKIRTIVRIAQENQITDEKYKKILNILQEVQV
ncbi:transcriptional regulator with XRE-family HTH domain [Tissierella praeacuta]|uniref:helix-turn-helix domain-containing protein n=1 Tax=Tissierella praeacuta TaxID=43131 RepID=UPI001053CE49|nr:helix-turn-helix domain-containing protein [Tissierella praeacuta]TCU74215.1 transcriptional regulator with XRE-family HTH domain [Tissierella praeacuta]